MVNRSENRASDREPNDIPVESLESRGSNTAIRVKQPLHNIDTPSHNIDMKEADFASAKS